MAAICALGPPIDDDFFYEMGIEDRFVYPESIFRSLLSFLSDLY